MRLLPILIAAALVLAAPAAASSLACGLKPLPPLGCSSSGAVCVCDADGNCRWVFVC
jgi:hypothetical protein